MAKRLPLLFAVVVAALATGGAFSSGLAGGPPEFHGQVILFADAPAPPGSYVRALVDGQPCGDAMLVADGQQTSYDIELAACAGNGGDIEFLWYRDDPSIATPCTPVVTWNDGAKESVDIACGASDTSGAVWIVQNTTGEVQRAVEIFPRVVLASLGVAEQPEACETPSTHAFFLTDHAEAVWPEPCISPGESVRLGLGTDCPCFSELEVERVVWLPGQPVFKANVDCNSRVDARDALLALMLSLEEATAPECVDSRRRDIFPNALSGVWGDIDCDRAVTAADAVIALRVTLGLDAGISPDCWAQYYGGGEP